MKKWFLKTNKYIIGLLLIISLLLIERCSTINELQSQIDNTTVESTIILPDDYHEIKNKIVDLEKENKDLLVAIEYLKSKNQTVKTITRIETKLVGQTEVKKEVPIDYNFKLENGMVVANIKHDNEDYGFTTYDLKFKTDILISDKETIVKLTGSSSYDDIEYILEPNKIVTYKNKETEKFKIFDPNIQLGLGVSYPLTGPEVVIGANLLTTKNDSFTFITPTISFSDTFKVGITPVQYNIGKPLPLVSNVRLGIGYETDFENHYGTINLMAKL